MKRYLKKIRSALFKVYIRANEKKHKRLKYLLQTNSSSDTLIVCFSEFGNGGAAKYNYINTLKSVDAHKLFILDNFGYNKQGTYYLGENGDWFLPDMIVDLVQSIRKELHINHLVMVGSSKGGSAALYYSILTEADACIIGAPQYFIGNYLNDDKHRLLLTGITGDASKASVDKLNCVMPECVRNNPRRKPRVYIHYSPKEHTYHEHIVDMLTDLNRCGYEVREDSDYEYTEHKDVAKHYPYYLLSVLETQTKK